MKLTLAALFAATAISAFVQPGFAAGPGKAGETVLYSFLGNGDGDNPTTGLTVVNHAL
jgi:hypothetical protein